MSKHGERARATIHLASSKAAGALRLTVAHLKSEAKTPQGAQRINMAEEQGTLILQNVPKLDFETGVRMCIEEAASAMLADIKALSPDAEVSALVELLLQHLAKMEFVNDLTRE